MEHFSVRDFMKLRLDTKFLLLGNALAVTGIAFCSIGNLLKLLNSNTPLPTPNINTTGTEVILEQSKVKGSFWDK